MSNKVVDGVELLRMIRDEKLKERNKNYFKICDIKSALFCKRR